MDIEITSFDPSRVNLLNVSSEYVFNLPAKEELRIEFTLEYIHDAMIQLKAVQKDLDVTSCYNFPEKEFYNILSESFYSSRNSKKSHLFSDHAIFKYAKNKLMDDIILCMNQNNTSDYLLGFSSSIHMQKGLGLVQNQTKEEIATFEDLFLSLEDNGHPKVEFNHIITLNGSIEWLVNSNHSFIFFDLERNQLLTFNNFHDSNADNSNLEVTDFSVTREPFPQNHNRYRFIKEQQEEKSMILGLDLNNPLNHSKYLEFKNKRINIISNFKDKMRKEEIYNEFADIEL
ncbi:hypothetical protein [Virgibacillus salexigens]|uniref:Uncharacterized protein n=1 Tax=Virgibacillus massiliensis TaxID=1462526 RepID=A0A024QIA0_9BACI|nr:hypothetical protein [Virgibacillus massiliensis]CDQ41910.1 hypothetical protein BN990_04289 [Virgibacillus massiliensis]